MGRLSSPETNSLYFCCRMRDLLTLYGESMEYSGLSILKIPEQTRWCLGPKGGIRGSRGEDTKVEESQKIND
jgi:hypothetical protein